MLYDFMPLEENQFHARPQGIYRCIRVDQGRVDFVLTLEPRPGYGLDECVIAEKDGSFTISQTYPPLSLLHTLRDFNAEGIGTGTLTLSFSLQAGESSHFDLICGQFDPEKQPLCPFKSPEPGGKGGCAPA